MVDALVDVLSLERGTSQQLRRSDALAVLTPSEKLSPDRRLDSPP